jgi:hypothetical protein
VGTDHPFGGRRRQRARALETPAPVNPLLKQLIEGTPATALPGDSPLVAPAKPAIQKIRYSHQAMIDMIIAEPWISQNELADRFGMSASWISTIHCSDIFQAKLAECREKLVDPQVRASLKVQFEGMLSRSLEILREKLRATPEKIPDQLAVQVMKVTSQSLGYGVREARVSVQETHVHLEELGNNLVHLLRRRKSEVYDHEAPRHQAFDQGHSQLQQSRTSEGASAPQQKGQLGVLSTNHQLQSGDPGRSGLVHPLQGGGAAPTDGLERHPPAPEVRSG